MRRIAALLALSACYVPPHVRLRAPAPDAKLVARVDAYGRLRPQQEGKNPPLPYPYNRPSDAVDYLVLSDGTKVYQPDDLLPVVDADSPTAAAARRHRLADDLSRWGLYTGGLLGVVGGGIVIGGIVSDDRVLGGTGAVLMASGIVVGAIAGLVFFPRIRREREESFRRYEVDLRRRLRLCVEGFDLVDCSPP